jgi:hypothetical protein
MRTIVLAATLTLALQAAAQSPVVPAIGPRIAHKTIRPVVRLTKRSLTVRYIRSNQLSASYPSPRAHQAAKLVAVAQPATTSVATVAATTPAPFAQNPIVQLRGNARAILIFAPDTTSPALLRQFAMLERNELALSERDAVLVPIIARHHGADEAFPGENINPGTEGDQLSARLKFGVASNDFAIILLDKDGTEQLRSSTPVTVASIGARIDGLPGPGE